MSPFDLHAPIKYCAQVQAFLSMGSVLLRSSVTGQSVVTDHRTAKIASLCTDFATLVEHCSRLTSQTGAELKECEAILRLAINKGLCVSQRQLSELIQCSFRSGSAFRHIDTIGIPTCNRPRILDRILHSISGHLREQQQNVTVLIMDDSSTKTMQEANATVVAAHAKLSGLKIRYVDQDARKHYITTLARKSGVDRRIVAFGLERSEYYPVSAGAARNMILLQSLGHYILSLDDDIACRIVSVPGSTDGIEFADGTASRWFLKDADEVYSSRFVSDNLLDLHEKMLNMNAGTFTSPGQEITWTGSIPLDLYRRAQPGRARIIASQMGILGDCGIDDTMPFYLQDSDGWSELVRNESSYSSGIRNRLTLTGAKNFMITPRIHSQAGCLGLDNTNGLPPFLPVMRGEDVVLGLLMRVCEPDGLFGLIPRAILHSPETARTFPPLSTSQRTGRFSLAETINLLITGTGGAWGRDSMERLYSLARSLHELKRADDRDLRDHLHRIIVPVLRNWMQKLEQRLDKSKAEIWTNDIRYIRDQLLCGLNHFDHLRPFDLQAMCGDDEAPSRLREVVSNFADFLDAWPTLVFHAHVTEYVHSHL